MTNVLTNLEEISKKDLEEFEISEENLDDSLKLYKKEISKYPLLEEEEQEELMKKYKESKDINIKNKIVNHNLRLAIFMAHKYQYVCQTMELLDLIQECNFTLFDSIDKFDPDKNVKFSTYAAKAMERSLQKNIDNKDRIIRKPVRVEVINFRYKKFMEYYYEKNKCYPSDEEIKEELNITDYQLNQQKEFDLLNPESLNKKIDIAEGDGDELENFISNQKDDYHSYNVFLDTQILLISAKKILTKKEYYIIYERYISDNRKSLEQVGKECKFTRERTRQIEKKALNKMKAVLKKYQKSVLEEYSINEIENLNLKPLSPSEIAVYYNLKENLDKETYYYLYNIRENKYDINILSEKFNFLEEEEIKGKIDSSIEFLEYFKKKNKEECLNKMLEKFNIDKILELNIEPEISTKDVEKQHEKSKKSKELLKK